MLLRSKRSLGSEGDTVLGKINRPPVAGFEVLAALAVPLLTPPKGKPVGVVPTTADKELWPVVIRLVTTDESKNVGSSLTALEETTLACAWQATAAKRMDTHLRHPVGFIWLGFIWFLMEGVK